MSIQCKRVLLVCFIVLVCKGNARASDERVEFLGDYTHVESATGEHCKGYDIILWKYKRLLIGFINHHRGLYGDPPMGLLEDTLYDPLTGTLLFKAKLSDGCMPTPTDCVPSKEIITFKGTLQGSILEGTVSWYSVDRNQQMFSEKVTLRASGQHRGFENYDKWMDYWGPILKFRGPKWSK